MTGFYEATAQQITGKFQVVSTARSYSAGFAFSALLSDCRYDAVLPEIRLRPLFLKVESWMPLALYALERIGAMSQVESISINLGSC